MVDNVDILDYIDSSQLMEFEYHSILFNHQLNSIE
jgi:hypothetical protein